jgi:hypothetical protein
MRYFVRMNKNRWEVVQRGLLFSQVVAFAATRKDAIACMVRIASEENSMYDQ